MVKKHEYYPELYKNIELCIERVQDLEFRGRISSFPVDFFAFTKDDITVYMSDKSFKPSDQELILSDWDDKRSLAIRDLEHALYRIEYKEVEETYYKAERFFYLHRLFFSDEISTIAHAIIHNTYVLLLNLDPVSKFVVDSEYIEKLREEKNEINAQINELRLELFTKLQKELKTENKHE